MELQEEPQPQPQPNKKKKPKQPREDEFVSTLDHNLARANRVMEPAVPSCIKLPSMEAEQPDFKLIEATLLANIAEEKALKEKEQQQQQVLLTKQQTQTNRKRKQLAPKIPKPPKEPKPKKIPKRPKKSEPTPPLPAQPIPPPVALGTICRLKCTTVKIGTLLKICEVLERLLKHQVTLHFSPQGLTILESREEGNVTIHIVLDCTFFERYEFQDKSGDIQLCVSSKQLLNDIKVLKQHHHSECVNWDVYDDHLIPHGTSSNMEHIQLGKLVSSSSSNPVTTTAAPVTTPEQQQYAMIHQMPSERFKNHCVSAKLQQCQDLYFVYDPVQSHIMIRDPHYNNYCAVIHANQESSSASPMTEKIEGIFPMNLILPLAKIHKINRNVRIMMGPQQPLLVEYPIAHAKSLDSPDSIRLSFLRVWLKNKLPIVKN